MKKKNLFAQLLALVSLIALQVACTAEDALVENPQNNKTTIRAHMPQQAETRMTYTNAYDEGGEKLELKWEVGDEFYIYQGTTKKATFKIENAGAISNDGKSASFTYTGEGAMPAITNGVAYFSKEPTEIFGGLDVYVPTQQSANDSRLFGNEGKLPMKAESINISAGATSLPDITFGHMAYVLKFSFRLPEVTNRLNPTTVELTAQNNVLAVNNNDIKKNSIFTLTDYDLGNAATSFDVYIPLFSTNWGFGSYLIVTLKSGETEIGKFSATPVGESTPFEAGKMYTATIAFDGSDKPGTPVKTSVFDNTVAGMTDFSSVSYEGGDGGEATPIEIGSAQQLKKLIEEVKGGNNYAGKYFKLTTDIHVTANTWTSLGDYNKQFWGNFNGNGHAITGTLNLGTAEYSGFLGYIYGSTSDIVIKNLTVAATITSSGSEVGGILGYIQDNTSNVTIENCHFSGNLIASRLVGGILGRFQSSNSITIRGCTSRGNITSTSTDYSYAGGIVGGIDSDCTVTACKNYAKVTGVSDRVGGIAGYTRAATISNCINYGNIDGKALIGGIVGSFSYGVTYTNNENFGTIGNVNATKVGGIVGSIDFDSGNTLTGNINHSSEIYGISYVGGLWGKYNATPAGNTNSSELPDNGKDGTGNQP